MNPVLRLRERKILIIEHNQSRLLKLQDQLSGAGFRHLIAVSDSKSVFDAIRPFQGKTEEIGAILLAYSLPQCNTLELSKLLTTLDNHHGIPLVFLLEDSVVIDDKLLEQLQEANAVSMLHYAENSETLTSVVSLALALKNERDERIINDEKLVVELAERRVMEARLQYLISHDELTGLSNRSGLEKTLNFAILRCKNFKQKGALLDVDD